MRLGVRGSGGCDGFQNRLDCAQYDLSIQGNLGWTVNDRLQLKYLRKSPTVGARGKFELKAHISVSKLERAEKLRSPFG